MRRNLLLSNGWIFSSPKNLHFTNQHALDEDSSARIKQIRMMEALQHSCACACKSDMVV